MRCLIVSGCSGDKSRDSEVDCDALNTRSLEELKQQYETIEAAKLYTGQEHQLIQSAYEKLGQICDVDWLIVSAGYGVVTADESIVPYECSIPQPRSELERQAKQLGITDPGEIKNRGRLIARIGEAKDIPGDLRKWLNDNKYNLIFVALGEQYLQMTSGAFNDLPGSTNGFAFAPNDSFIGDCHWISSTKDERQIHETSWHRLKGEQLLTLVENMNSIDDMKVLKENPERIEDWTRPELGTPNGDEENASNVGNSSETRKINDLEPHPLYDDLVSEEEIEESIEKLIKSIENGGMVNPITINEKGEIIDGYARFKAVRRIDENKEVHVNIKQFDSLKDERRGIIHADIFRKRTFSEIVRRAEILMREENQDVVANYFDWSEDTLRKARRVYEAAQDGDKIAMKEVEKLDNQDSPSIDPAYEAVNNYSEDDSDDEWFQFDSQRFIKRQPSGLTSAGEYQFLPVVGYDSQVSASDVEHDITPVTVGDNQLTWWEENSLTPQYPYALINAVGYPDLDDIEVDELESFAKAFRFDSDNQFVLADSGGFQMRTRHDIYRSNDPEEHTFADGKINPEKLLDWQVRNADAGIILDQPPYDDNKESSHQMWVTEFELALEKTRRNAVVMSDRLETLRTKDISGAEDFDQLAVIQGQKSAGDDPWVFLRKWHFEMKEAMGALRDPHDAGTIDGYALKPYTDSLDSIALHLAYAAVECRGVDHIHVLQVSGIRERILFSYFAMLTNFFVTSDSASHTWSSIHREFSEAGQIPEKFVHLSDRDTEPFDRLPCTCSVCRNIERNQGIEWLTEEDPDDGNKMSRSLAIGLHNLTHSLTYARLFIALMRKEGKGVVDRLALTPQPESDESEFWTVMLTHFNHRQVWELWKAMRQVKIAVEQEDLDAVMDDHAFTPATDSPSYEFEEPSLEADAMEW